MPNIPAAKWRAEDDSNMYLIKSASRQLAAFRVQSHSIIISCTDGVGKGGSTPSMDGVGVAAPSDAVGAIAKVKGAAMDADGILLMSMLVWYY